MTPHRIQPRPKGRAKNNASTTVEEQRTVWIVNESGARLEIKLTLEGDTLLGRVEVDGVPYHVFLATTDEVSVDGKYSLDHDPDYLPRQSPTGQYLLMSPYCDNPS